MCIEMLISFIFEKLGLFCKMIKVVSYVQYIVIALGCYFGFYGLSVWFLSCAFVHLMLLFYEIDNKKCMKWLNFFLNEKSTSNICAYSTYDKKTIPKLKSPPQLLRGELIANEGIWFKDDAGRRIILRGVNVSGSSKYPIGGSSHITCGFYDTHNISFVGRPFLLKEADEHMRRLNAWGMTFVRLIVTWEAIEHTGPGVYDEEYLDYLLKVVRIAKTNNISVFIDPHQDVWSRWTGGDGAPAWTLDIVGFDIKTLHETGCAYTEQGSITQQSKNQNYEKTEKFSEMYWPSNHHKLATATMNTLFFGGKTFAPNLMVNGENIQDYLQNHFFAAFAKVAEKLVHETNVIGFDTMNEPNLGMIGWKDLSKPSKYLRQGASPTFFESFQLGSGISKSVQTYSPSLVPNGKTVLNIQRQSAWTSIGGCVWKKHGVWEIDSITNESVLLKKNFFNIHVLDGIQQEIHPQRDFFVPFVMKFREKIDKKIKELKGVPMLFFFDRNTDFEDSSVSSGPIGTILETSQNAVDGFVFAPHWYDLVPLVSKTFYTCIGIKRDTDNFQFPLVFGKENLISEYARQFQKIKSMASRLGGGKGVPTIIGETGIPFDLANKLAYETGDFHLQNSAMNVTMSALDKALLSAIIWNYTPTNTNSHGDGWNTEDLSIFSNDQIKESEKNNIFAGGRALPALLRPYAFRCAGTPIKMEFDMFNRKFVLEFENDITVVAPTIIFVPYYQYLDAPMISVSDGGFIYDRGNQMLTCFHDTSHTTLHRVEISPQ